MKNITLLSLAFMLITFASCRKDEVFTEKDDPVFPGPTTQVISAYSGVVVDVAGLPIVDAQVVDENGNTTVTDKNGVFQVTQGTFAKGGSLFKVEKQDYIDGFKFVHINVGQKGYAKVVLLERVSRGEVQSGSGGEIEIHNAGASLELDANSVVQENGSAYSGVVNVYAHWYDPSDQNLGAQMPGDLRGVDTENNNVILETYGMVYIELEGANGEKLNLKENTTAKIEFPIVENQLSAAPEQIPLWYLDEGTGYWKEEGQAVKTENVYVARVSHFSFWNCDYPYPLIELSGTVEDEDGNLLQNVLVSISIVNSGQSGSGYTNNFGYFEGKVPKGEMFELNIYYDNCEGLAYTSEIGPFEEDTDLGTIILENLSEGLITYSGSAYLCDGVTPITNGYVSVISADGSVYSVVDILEDGSYSGSLIICDGIELNFQAVDLDAIAESQIVAWESTSGASYVVADLQTCSNLDEYLIVNIDGSSRSLSGALCGKLNDLLSINYLTGNGTISFGIYDNGSQNLPVTSVVGNIPGWFDFRGEIFDDLIVELSSNPSEVGDFIIGNISGNLIDDNEVEHTLEIDFKVKLLENNYEIKLWTWGDLNENGIYDFGSEGPDMEQQFKVTDTDQNIYNAVYSDHGLVRFSIPVGKTVDIEVLLNGQTLTLSNVSSTETDNDFEQDGFIRDVLMDQPREFYCGILPGAMACTATQTTDCNSTCFEVLIEGGIPPYQYILNGDVIASLDPANSILLECNYGPGIYDIILTDALGDQCNTVIELIELSDLDVDISLGVINCQDDTPVGDEATVFVTGGTLPYAYEWSNGVNGQSFPDVFPGTYSVTVTDANGCFATAEKALDETMFVILGRVWDDNLGSIPNEYESETGVEATINLLNADDVVVETYISTDGTYGFVFEDYDNGEYSVEIILPTGYELVDKDSASSDDVDSDADPMTRKTDAFVYEGCAIFVNLNFGLK